MHAPLPCASSPSLACTGSRSNVSTRLTNLPTDGNWHMITITTEPRPGQLGFQLYVDGGFAGDASDQIPGLKMNEVGRSVRRKGWQETMAWIAA